MPQELKSRNAFFHFQNPRKNWWYRKMLEGQFIKSSGGVFAVSPEEGPDVCIINIIENPLNINLHGEKFIHSLLREWQVEKF